MNLSQPLKGRILLNSISLSEFSPVIEEVVNGGGKVKVLASGESMHPTIKDKTDTLTLSQVSGELKLNDIVLFKRDNGKLVLHRIIGENENGFVLRGDSQWTTETVKKEQIIAVLESVERNGKSIDYKKYDAFLPLIRWERRIINSIKIRLGAILK